MTVKSHRLVRIFLIGFMGVGKSTLGKLLAKKQGKDFYDLDHEIVARAGISIPEIFSQLGQDHFRQLERECLHHIMEEREDFILATGGGLPCHFDNLDRMKAQGLTIHLKAEAVGLTTRLKRKLASRPMLRNHEAHLLEHVSTLIEQRLPYYEKAHLTIELDLDADPEANCQHVIELIAKSQSGHL